jgi:hypothetical protein
MRHLPDQLAQVLWQSRSASLSRLPSPEPPVRSAMPFKECLRLDNDQGFTPIEESGEQDHESACSSVRTSRPQLAFLKQSELFPKEQVLGDEGGAGGKEQANEREQATFYKSLQVLLSVSESRISFLRRTGRRGLRSHGHGLGQACWPNCPSLRKVIQQRTPVWIQARWLRRKSFNPSPPSAGALRRESPDRGSCMEAPRAALESLALEAYRSLAISAEQLRRLLVFETRMQVDVLLKEHEIFDYSAVDFELDRETLRELRMREARP